MLREVPLQESRQRVRSSDVHMRGETEWQFEVRTRLSVDRGFDVNVCEGVRRCTIATIGPSDNHLIRYKRSLNGSLPEYWAPHEDMEGSSHTFFNWDHSLSHTDSVL